MSVSEIAHSGRYVINFHFRKKRQTHCSFPGSHIGFASREDAKRCEACIRAKLLGSAEAAPLPIGNATIRSFFLGLADKKSPPPRTIANWRSANPGLGASRGWTSGSLPNRI